MERDYSEQTLPLWDDNSSRTITLRNLRTGEKYSFVLKHSFVVGRTGACCDMQITCKDRYMSGKHLRFTSVEGGVYVEDLHSKNGSRVNGRFISSRTRIRTGDILKLGRSEYEVTV